MAAHKLPPGEAERRRKERSVKTNAVAKAKRDRERALGIPPSYKNKPLTPEKKAEAIERTRLWRAKKRLLNPPRVPMTKEQKRLRAIEKTRAAYDRKLLAQGKTRKLPPRPREKKVKPPKIKPVKMEKILKARPANRISEKVIKPVKEDARRQTICEIKADDTGKIKVRLDAKTEVYAKPGYDIEALKKKFRIGIW